MKKVFKWSVVSLVLICELCFLLLQGVWLHGPVFDVSYRHDQRVAAFWDDHLHPSPATKATLDTELKRMDRYLAVKMVLIVGVFVGIDWLGLYCFRNYGHKKTTA
jgi:uncharacterized membrane protein (UPF0182 family)